MNPQRELRRRRYCPECDRDVLAAEAQPNYQIHVLASALSCGLWLPVALCYLAYKSLAPTFLCPKCGTTCEK